MSTPLNQAVTYVASGCFWGTQYHFAKMPGVIATTMGYMGGAKENPTYKEVCTGTTGHFECVEIKWDRTKTTLEDVLKLYFETHDFSQEDGQGPDIGSQYLSRIFFSDASEIDLATKLMSSLEKKGYHVATKILPVTKFWPAEEYHQDYYFKHNKEPYCHTYKKVF